MLRIYRAKPLNPLCQRPRFRASTPTTEASARRIRLQERRWGFLARRVLTIERQATVAAAFGELWEVIGRWQNLALGLWLEEDARVAEAVTLTLARRAAELCTSTAVIPAPVCRPDCEPSASSSSSVCR